MIPRTARERLRAVYDELYPYRSALVMPDVIRHPEAGGLEAWIL